MREPLVSPDNLSRQKPTKPLAFMHIPKTAGMALSRALVATLSPSTFVEGFDLSHFLLTVLRGPNSRLLSHWLFWRSHRDTELERWGVLADPASTHPGR
jgi:hypothetical protein